MRKFPEESNASGRVIYPDMDAAEGMRIGLLNFINSASETIEDMRVKIDKATDEEKKKLRKEIKDLERRRLEAVECLMKERVKIGNKFVRLVHLSPEFYERDRKEKTPERPAKCQISGRMVNLCKNMEKANGMFAFLKEDLEKLREREGILQEQSDSERLSSLEEMLKIQIEKDRIIHGLSSIGVNTEIGVISLMYLGILNEAINAYESPERKNRRKELRAAVKERALEFADSRSMGDAGQSRVMEKMIAIIAESAAKAGKTDKEIKPKKPA